MTPIEGNPILSAARMREAEARAIAAGTSASALMERAGAGVAEAVHRLAAGAPVLVLCGPGNNGGDGYVAARILKANGVDVRVGALGVPKSHAAMAASVAWGEAVEDVFETTHGQVVVDALFGTGLTRPLAERLEERWVELMSWPHLSIAVDVPSGLDSDQGVATPRMLNIEVTLALGALKPAHVLYPAAAHCGNVRLIDIGLGPFIEAGDRTVKRTWVAAPDATDHKYTRGLVVVIGGIMAGAAALAAEAAMHAGAGYVALLEDAVSSGKPHALVRKKWSPGTFFETVKGKRSESTAVVVGPGLGRGDDARSKLDAAIDCGYPLVIDGDALHLLGDDVFARFKAREWDRPVILTPHAGEFAALFGRFTGNKIDAARAAAEKSGATVIFKGADTVISHPEGSALVAVGASPWLSTAGTGDVLAGTVGAMLATQPYDPAEAAVWMHNEAARRLGGAFIADDLARELSAVRALL